MKNRIVGLFFVLAAVLLSYFIYKEITHDPLTKDEFATLFNANNGSIKKACVKDFLGISAKGEYFEAFRYKVSVATMDKSFPRVTKREKRAITNETKIGKWNNCPLDSQVRELYNFTLTVNNFDEVECLKSFNEELANPNNYFAYIHFNELEEFFFLYCTDRAELYYIRRKGF